MLEWLLKKLPIVKKQNFFMRRYRLIATPWFTVFLHKIHRDTEPDNFHTHDWNAWSFIFGGYTEEIMGEGKYKRRFFNRVSAYKPHRIEVQKPVWTIFIHGRACNRWQVIHRDGTVLDEKR